MKITSARPAWFSPTGTTRRVLNAIIEGTGLKAEEAYDLTPPDSPVKKFEPFKGELAVLGGPVYMGRIPPVAVERLRCLRGNDTPAVVVAVYGNREYDDALLELRDIAAEQGFRPVAGAAFIGEHTSSTAEYPIAAGRPDDSDVEKAREFGLAVVKKLEGISSAKEISLIEVPGNSPYKKFPPPAADPVSPWTDDVLCTRCGDCASACPTAAIVVADEVMTDAKECIRCRACIRVCAPGARKVWPGTEERTKWLMEAAAGRKEPVVFL